ncbi:MAG TPA: hypothetical protein DCS29_01085 [Candidatus Magasanikbacteria bacterium]|nr:hypothetical protein [Candidatus Magasanikbacteria bacterium]
MPVSPIQSGQHEITSASENDLVYLCSELEKDVRALQQEGRMLKVRILGALDQHKISDVLQNIIDLPHH